MRHLPLPPKYENSIPELPTANSNSKDTLGSKLQIPESFVEFARRSEIYSEGVFKQFELFPYQIELAKIILSGKYKTIYIIKSRQLGISLLIGCILSYKALREAGFSAFVVSLGQKETSIFGRNCRSFLENWQATFDSDNVREHILENKSSISYLANTATIGRGSSTNAQVYDESAFYPLRTIKGSSAASKIWGGENSSVSISLSTPSDKASEFYELLSQGNPEPYEQIAEKVVNGEYPPFYYWQDELGALKIVIHYTAVPKFAENPRLYTALLGQEGLSDQEISREADLKFSDTSGNTLDYTKVNNVFCLTDEERVPYDQLRRNGWDIVCGLDASEYGKDQTASVILAVNTKLYRIRICSEFYMDQPDYAEWESWLKRELGKTKATILIERNGCGGTAFAHCTSYTDISLFHKVDTYFATEDTKLQTLDFLSFAVNNGMIEGYRDLVTLKEQLKRYDLAEQKGAGTQKDDGVSALMHGFQFLNYEKWYRFKRGLTVTNQTSQQHLVGGKLTCTKIFSTYGDSRF